MFWGTRNRRLDAKKRLSLSRKIRIELGDEPFIVKYRNYLRIYPEKTEKKFKPSGIWKTIIDKQGRILIPTRLLKSIPYGLETNNIILSGEGDYIKIQPGR